MSDLNPDHTNIKPQKSFGTVNWFNEKMGYGFIKTQEGKDVYVHYSAIQMEDLEAYKALKEGDNVKFEVVEGKKGLQAINVVKINEFNLIPNQILKKYKNKELDYSTAIEYLRTIIENSNIEVNRLEALEEISKIPSEDDDIFQILENILISDSVEDMRILSVKIVINKFLNKARKVLKWVIEREKSIKIVISIYNELKRANSDISRKFIKEMARCIGNEYIHTYDIDPKEAMGLKFLEKITRVKAVEGGYMDYDVLSFNVKDKHIYSLDIHDIDFDYYKEHEIRSITFLELFPHLKYLKISCCHPVRISGLETLANLQYLTLDGNKITEIKGLENLTKLRELDLSWNQISEIKGLDTLTNLENLNLDNNQISEIKGLRNFSNLRILNLNENQINEIKGLDTLTNLENLYLDNNQITEIKGLEVLTNLRVLLLDYKKIKDFYEKYEEFRKKYPHIQIT